MLRWPLSKPEVIVTGTAKGQRTRGFRQGLEEISIKTAGPAIFAMPVVRTSKVSLETALQKSLDAFVAWVRSDKNASLCGVATKF